MGKTKLEIEAEIIEEQEDEERRKKELEFTNEIKKIYSTYKTLEEGGKPYNKGWLHEHNSIYIFQLGPYDNKRYYYVCVRCGEVHYSKMDNRIRIVGYLDPNKETLSSYISKEVKQP